MRIYGKDNVLEAARKRVSFIFDEFKNVSVSFSGGKDSTVVLGLALEEACRRGRLPLDVVFVDQEHEWEDTISYTESLLNDERIRLHWFQVRIRMTNNANMEGSYTVLWGDDCSRLKHPRAIHEIPFERFQALKTAKYKELVSKGVPAISFKEMFHLTAHWIFNGETSCSLLGVRGFESPGRMLGLTRPCYKWVTWGASHKKKDLADYYTLWPIYDWTLHDVWKYIFESKLDYCRVYDKMYSAGWGIRDMRVSNLHHEIATLNIKRIQEVCSKTWDRVSGEIDGMHTLSHMTTAANVPSEIPWMFDSWTEYRDYLVEKLLSGSVKERILELFELYPVERFGAEFSKIILRAHIRTVLLGDTLGIVLTQLKSKVFASATAARCHRDKE